MNVSAREKLLVIITLAVVGIYGADAYVIGPFLGARDASIDELARLQTDIADAAVLFDRSTARDRRWRDMGITRDPSEAETACLHALRKISDKASLNLDNIKPYRATDRTELRRLAFTASGQGDIAAVTRFCELLDTATVPLRIESLQLHSDDASGGVLRVDLRVSTLFQADPPARARPRRDAGPEADL